MSVTRNSARTGAEAAERSPYLAHSARAVRQIRALQPLNATTQMSQTPMQSLFHPVTVLIRGETSSGFFLIIVSIKNPGEARAGRGEPVAFFSGKGAITKRGMKISRLERIKPKNNQIKSRKHDIMIESFKYNYIISNILM